MKREIKFRGISIQTGKWVYGYLYTIENVEHYILEQCVLGLLHTEVIPETVGQFTGLKDRNKNEIYEGDILKGCYVNGHDAKIIYDHSCFCVYSLRKDIISYDTFRIMSYSVQTSIIIGNIHQNPELLK